MDLLDNYIVGIILIVTGLIVVKYPRMLNVMTKERQRKTDMNAVGRMACKCFLCMGLCQIIGAFFMTKYELWAFSGLFNLLLVMIGSVIIVVKANSRKYRK